MPRQYSHSPVEVVLSGVQLAVLSGASTVFSHWPFENLAAQDIRASIPIGHVRGLSEDVSKTTEAHFRSRGLWPREPWSRDLMDRRAATSTHLTLSEQQVRTAVAALRASVAEFSERWEEFYTVAPGGLWMYKPTPADAIFLADMLEAAVSDGAS